MSVRATDWAWGQALRGVAEGKLLTLLRVADHADNDGICWPGQKEIAQYTTQDPRTVRRHLSELETEGLLHREEQKRGNGGRSSDRIILALPPRTLEPGPPGHGSPPPPDTRDRAYEPSVEPSTEIDPPLPPVAPLRGESSPAVLRALKGSKRQRDVEALRAFDAQEFPGASPQAVSNARWRLKKAGRAPTVEALAEFLRTAS